MKPSHLLFFTGVILLYVRLYWGIDFTDESYMILNAIGPLLGAKPFVAERMISQTGSLLVLPIAFVYKFIVGDLTGVVLFFRHIYFFVAVGTALVLYRALRGKLTETDRALTALLPLVFISGAQPVPSYNTLALMGGLAGQMLFLGFHSGWAGSLHALASFAHPAYLLGAITNFVTSLWSRRAGDARAYGVGGPLLVILVLILIAVCGAENLVRALELSSESSTFGGGAKIAALAKATLGIWHNPILVMICAGAFALMGLAGRLDWATAFAVFALTQTFLIPEENVYGLHERFIGYGLYSAWLILFDRRGWRDSENRTWLARLWLPSFVAGWSFAYVSSNGLLMAPLGWVGCLVYIFWRMLRHRPPVEPSLKAWRGAFQTACALLILVQAQIFTLTHFYRDDSLPSLDTRVNSGPYYGLYTTYQRRNFIEEFTGVMAEVRQRIVDPEHRPPRIFVYDLFAAGYLLAPFQPNGPAYMSMLPQWMPQTRPPLVRYFEDPDHWPDVVVEFFRFPFGTQLLVEVNPRESGVPGDPFKNFFLKTGQFRVTHETEIYRVMQRIRVGRN